VIDFLVASVTFQKRNDQLLVPLWRVLGPSLSSVWYVTLSMLKVPFPMRFTYGPGMAL